MAHWTNRQYVARLKKVAEWKVVLLALCVASGVDADTARYYLSVSRLDQLVPPSGGRQYSTYKKGDLSPGFALAGCVLRKCLTREQIRQIDIAACAQYPRWGEIKQDVRHLLSHGFDPRRGDIRRSVCGECRWEKVPSLTIEDEMMIARCLEPDSRLVRRNGSYAIVGEKSYLLLRCCAMCGYVALIHSEEAVCPGCAGVLAPPERSEDDSGFCSVGCYRDDKHPFGDAGSVRLTKRGWCGKIVA